MNSILLNNFLRKNNGKIRVQKCRLLVLTYLGKSYPEYSFEPKGIFADGDIVFFLSSQKYTKEHAGVFVVDIWRIEDKKVVEHWDITEEITASKFHENEMIFDYKQE